MRTTYRSNFIILRTLLCVYENLITGMYVRCLTISFVLLWERFITNVEKAKEGGRKKQIIKDIFSIRENILKNPFYSGKMPVKHLIEEEKQKLCHGIKPLVRG
jgi:hypothetical protein